MSNVRKGDIRLVAFDWAPAGWRTIDKLANAFLVGASGRPGGSDSIRVPTKHDHDHGRFLVLHYIEAVQDQDLFRPFLGEIQPFAGNGVPRDWMPCAGQGLPISRYMALFSLIGETFGGEIQRNSFLLPDLRNRIPTGKGDGDKIGALIGGFEPAEGDVNSDALRVTNGRLAMTSMNYLIRVNEGSFPPRP